uniref:Uncharacterized protein n=1 Tax=Kalanchoe fedtschenkoi TaxID=63787 RepID=A0A7N0TJ82_KALFE
MSVRTTWSWLFTLCLSAYVLTFLTERNLSHMWPVSLFYSSVVYLVGVLLALSVVLFMARATLLMWVTVLVLLTFSGKRRRILVDDGTRIATDVAISWWRL